MNIKSFLQCLSVGVLTLCFGSISAQSQTICILPTATGNGSGADWNNAMGGFPSTLTPGITYYVGSGTYANGIPGSASAGSSMIYIFKATAATNSTQAGWQSSYGTGQAIFTCSSNYGIVIYLQGINNLYIDGLTGSGTSGYGILFTNYPFAPANSGIIEDADGYVDTNLTFRHLEIASTGPLQSPNNNEAEGCYFNDSSSGWINFQYCYIHDMYEWLNTGPANNILIEHCYFQNCGSGNSDNHCAGWTFGGKNCIFRYNYIGNILYGEGTAYTEAQFGANYTYIYDNVFNSPSNQSQIDTGCIYVDGSVTANSYISYTWNNTFYAVRMNTSSGMYAHTGSNYAYNNLFQGCFDINGNVITNMNFIGYTSLSNILNTGVAQFVNTNALNLGLSAELAGTNLTSLSPINIFSSYNTDYVGNPFGSDNGIWSMGAYQYVTTTTNTNVPLPAPQSLVVTNSLTDIQ